MNLSAMIGKVFFTQSQPRSVIYGTRLPYTGEQLREIRKRKGVGRPPWLTLLRRQDYAHWISWPTVAIKPYLGTNLGGWNTDTPNRNFAEWERKQRRGETAEAWRDRIVADTLAKIQASLGEMGYWKAT